MCIEELSRSLRHICLAAAVTSPLSAVAETSEVTELSYPIPSCGDFSDVYRNFALSMIAHSSGSGAENAIISPSSVEATLAMMYQGATVSVREKTAEIFTRKNTGNGWPSECRLDELSTQKVSNRVALMIGNADYAVEPWQDGSPVRDATDIGAALGRLGFEVTELENTDLQALRRGIQDFENAAAGAEIALVFYGGHGMETNGQYYLVPIDARVEASRPPVFESLVPLDLVLDTVAGVSGFGLVILDTAPNNPFTDGGTSVGPSHSLIRPEVPGETLIVFASGNGENAQDDMGQSELMPHQCGTEGRDECRGTRNRPYTAALLDHMEEPDLDVGSMLSKVGQAVKEATDSRQEPVTFGSLSGVDVYLAGDSPGPVLSRANAIFADRTLDVFPAFQNAVTDRLGADFKQFDFTDRNTVDLINTWISDATNRVIPKLLDSLDPDERLVLASALYYRGEWKQAFDSDNTVQAPFFPETGDPVDVAFMQSGNYPALFYEDENFSAVELRYESDRSAENLALRFILPEKNMAAQDALEKIRNTPALLGDLAAAKYGNGTIRLPRFKLEGSTDVLPLLQEHGFFRCTGLGRRLRRNCISGTTAGTDDSGRTTDSGREWHRSGCRDRRNIQYTLRHRGGELF